MREASHLPTVVDSYITLSAGAHGLAGHYATFESAVHGFASAAALRTTRRAWAEGHPELRKVPVVGAKTRRFDTPFWSPHTRTWAIPFPGSDASVVRRTQREVYADLLAKGAAGPSEWPGTAPLPVVYNAYASVPTTWALVLLVFYGILFGLLAQWEWGRRVLLAHPRAFSYGVFSHEGPTQAQLEGTHFALRAFARGYSPALAPAVRAAVGTATPLPKPDVSCIVEVSGGEPGYVATSAMVASAALTLLLDRGNAAAVARSSGVHTPGAVFRGTALRDRLIAAGIRFSVIAPPAAAAPAAAAAR
jgi:hypothetical protein